MNRPPESKSDVRSLQSLAERVREARRLKVEVQKQYGGRSPQYLDARDFARSEEGRLLDAAIEMFAPVGAEG